MRPRTTRLGLAVLGLLAPQLVHGQGVTGLVPATPAIPMSCIPCTSGLIVGLPQQLSFTTIADTGERKAIEYSDAYGTRLAIHRIASYTEIPLFVAEYLLGEKLLSDQRNGLNRGGEDGGSSSNVRGIHGGVAAGLGVLFAVNTITGGWNLYDSRHDSSGRTRRWVHTITMLAADAGFLWTASSAEGAARSNTGARTHRSRAVFSMSLATASTLMMWLWKD